MADVEEEALLAISLGFPPFRKSPLKSNTYHSIVRLFSLFDQHQQQQIPQLISGQEIRVSDNTNTNNNLLAENDQQNQLNSGQQTQEKEEIRVISNNDNNLLVELNSGQESEEKEEIRVSNNNNLLVENEGEDRVEIEEQEPTLDSWIDGGNGGLEQSLLEESVEERERNHLSETSVEKERDEGGDEVMMKDLEVEEGEISGDMTESNLLDDRVLEDSPATCTERKETTHVREMVSYESLFDKGNSRVCDTGRRNSEVRRARVGCKGDNLKHPRVISGRVVKKYEGKRPSATCTERKGKCERESMPYQPLLDLGNPSDFDSGLSNNEVKKAIVQSNKDSLENPGATSEKVVKENDRKTASVEGFEPGIKKRRTTTKERTEKKRAKRRKLRAEENRKSGVKRLKLQTISKPKTVNYCKYYLHGKCQQGHSCKFSHDTTPLTKSQPCRFLAQQSCLKGDDCPFDHELSKYPCDNYRSKGFCPRGDTCLFSHKMPLLDDSSPTSDVNRKAQENSCLQGSANSGKQLQKGSTFQQTFNKSKNMTPRTPASFGTITRHSGANFAEMNPTAQAPKGISFLSFGKSPCNDSSKQQQSELPAARDSDVSVSSTSQGASEKFQNSIEILERTPESELSVSQPSQERAEGQDKNLPNSARRTQSSTLEFASRYLSKMTNRSVQSTADIRTQSSQKLAKEQGKNIPNASQKALSSTLQFASKCESKTADQSVQSTATQSSQKMVEEQVNIPNSATKALSSTLQFASKYETKMAGQSVQSTALSGNIPTISSILQEFLFNGQ